ncbi:MAG TPA: SIS domain-containing protein [Mycobacteriales bacterium]|nr:SIS domain-containing protein [Mycobacteriales bacterium]
MTVADLDDVRALEDGDPQGMLRAVASSAAQVREAATLAREAGVARLAEGGRPRAVVVCGMGGSGIAGDVLAAGAGLSTPVPVLTHRAHGLPAWVGAGDVVMAVSCSGTTEETLSSLQEAARRGCALLVVGAEGSPVHAVAQQARAVFVPVPQGRQPRASVWALSTPLVLAGHALGLLSADDDAVEATARALEELAVRCRPDADGTTNPAKALAAHLQGAVPVVWGSSQLAGVAAYRFACQLNENAEVPAAWGVLPEAGHNQVVALDGPFGRGAGDADDFFRDRADDDDSGRLALVLLRDSEEEPRVAHRAAVLERLAQERGVPVQVVGTEGSSTFERLARLVAVGDYASTYLALAAGTDPTPVRAIDALKAALR